MNQEPIFWRTETRPNMLTAKAYYAYLRGLEFRLI